jgi:nucleoside phosphorylase
LVCPPVPILTHRDIELSTYVTDLLCSTISVNNIDTARPIVIETIPMQRRPFDIGIVVPLKEEYRYVVEVAPQLESISHEGTYFYRLDFGPISTICCVVDQAGPIPALQATIRLLEFADVKLVVLLGLAGALDKDIAVGDVVVAAEVNEFQANSKAEAAGEGYQIHYSGRHWPLDFAIREAISHFEFSGPNAFGDWKSASLNNYNALEIHGKELVCSSTPSLHLGPVASGTIVAASTAFVDEVKRINRKFVAIDMEAAGVAPATAERIHPLPCLVVRGISDPANESKKELEKQGNGAWRRYCVRNATSFLRQLLSWDGFLIAAELRTFATPSVEINAATELVVQLENCTGGPWLVGAAFGLYSHGPRLLDGGGAVPMDLSKLRISDPRVDELLKAADEAKEALFSGNVRGTAESLSTLIEQFRNQLRSPDVDSLLRQFDQVVLQILSPDPEEEMVESLILESDRLEEEIGSEAVIEFLKDVANKNPQLRERYVDALATTGEWPAVLREVSAIDPANLSRRELENGLYACANTGTIEDADAMMKEHENKYNDNAGALFRNEFKSRWAINR